MNELPEDDLKRHYMGENEAMARAALEVLLRRNDKSLRGAAYRMSGGDPHEADDVYGDTTLALWRKRRRYRPLPPPWVVWAIEVMRRCASGRRRHRAGQLESKTSVDSELTSWATSEEDSPETATINSMWREAVRASIRSLDEELQAVVVMRLFLNIPFREITKLLNLGEGPGPAYHRFAQALKQLRQSLSNSWGGDG